MKDGGPLPTVLLLGGPPGEGAAMEAALAGEVECLHATDPDSACAAMAENFVQVAVCAGDLAGTPCAEVLARLRAQWPETVVVAVCEAGAEPAADAGPALDRVLVRPWTPAELRVAVAAAGRTFRLMRENRRLALEMRCRAPARRGGAEAGPGGFESFLCAPGSPMSATVAAARQVASFDVPVLLSGEAGTGKAEMAAAIHAGSLRSDKPFQSFDCTGLPDAAIAAALFGAPRAEGGGRGARAGLLRRADHGSLYLAGVETLSAQMQQRLLRLARDGVYSAPDGAELHTSGARLIVGAAADLRARVAAGTFRADLYYALSIAELALPPLRARGPDLPLLARAAAEAAARAHGKRVQGLSEAALAFLSAYDWPGNLRELENEVTRMLIHAQEPVLGAELISRPILQAAPAAAERTAAAPGADAIMAGDGPLKDRLEAIEARILRETLTRLKWNKSRSAAELGLSRVGLRAKLDRHGIAPPETRTEEA